MILELVTTFASLIVNGINFTLAEILQQAQVQNGLQRSLWSDLCWCGCVVSVKSTLLTQSLNESLQGINDKHKMYKLNMTVNIFILYKINN
ncbi:MAG: hypothetical protein R2739_09205 [Chitinophagales bacterium]|nr:hypothetical protein [Bacteroidota bacterium]